MKKSKVMLASALILVASAVSSCNTFAGSMNIIEDTRPMSIKLPNSYEEYQQMDYPELFTVKYTKAVEPGPANEEVDLRENTNNPETFDNLGLIFGLIVVATVAFALLIIANMRKRGSVKPYYFGLFFGILAMATTIMFMSSKESFAVQYAPIENRDLYNAVKACFESANNEDEYYRLNCSASDNNGNPVDVVFDDSTMSISRPSSIRSLDLDGWVTNIKLSDISELSKFPNLERLFLRNNDISDVSVINNDNFAHLGGVDLSNNHIESFSDELYALLWGNSLTDQTLSYTYDEEGNSYLPPLYFEMPTRYYRCYFELHVYNLEINEETSTVRIINTSKDAYMKLTIVSCSL